MDKLKELLDKLSWKLVLVLIVLGAAGSYYMLDQSEIERRTQSIETSKTEITDLERKIVEAKEFEKQFDEKKKRYQLLVTQLQGLQGALPRQFLLAEILKDLLDETKAVELDVLKFKPDEKETPGELYTSWGFDLEVKGTYLQFLIFLDRLAHMKRLVSVQKIVIDRDETRKNVTLGGAEGAFGGQKLSGGRTVYPGLTATVRLLTYRYRGGGGSDTPPPQGNPQAVPPRGGGR